MKKSNKTNKEKVYAFIDSQNLNLGIKSQGWTLDFAKFRLYLRNKYNVDKAYLFIGMIPGNEELYSRLSEAGYQLVFKPTVEYKKGNKITHKGNVDAELVLYSAARVYEKYDRAIIVSADGDFKCLIDYLDENGKLSRILSPNAKYSSLLRVHAAKIDVVGKARKSLEVRNKSDQHRRSVETLGLSGHGDDINIAKKGKKSNLKKAKR